jgi:hypothetical protein
MSMGIYHRKSVSITILILLLAGLFSVPGFAFADTPHTPPSEIFHKPAYIQGKEDLVDVQVIPHSVPFRPRAPTSTDVDIVELLQQLNETLILGYLENLTGFGPRRTGTEGCNQSARYLYNTFAAMGLDVRYHNYKDSIVSGSNIEATLYGNDSTNIFIICAHYDTVSAGPGADDDGSGVAVVLAAAEIMRSYQFAHTVRFVAFSGEEQGLIGSRHYAQDAYTNDDPIVGVLNADMIGFAITGVDGSMGKIYENTASEWLVDYTQDISQVYSDYINIQLIPQGESYGSDHYYFWEYGFDAIFYHEHNFNDYYHSANDTIANMNLNYTARFSRLILATLASLARQPRPVLEVTNITGGLGVSTQVTNIGDDSASDVNVTIMITGGMFKFINTSTSTSSSLLQPQDTLQLKAVLFRLGTISITVIADASNADEVMRQATGFLFGPFVLKVTLVP